MAGIPEFQIGLADRQTDSRPATIDVIHELRSGRESGRRGVGVRTRETGQFPVPLPPFLSSRFARSCLFITDSLKKLSLSLCRTRRWTNHLKRLVLPFASRVAGHRHPSFRHLPESWPSVLGPLSPAAHFDGVQIWGMEEDRSGRKWALARSRLAEAAVRHCP